MEMILGRTVDIDKLSEVFAGFGLEFSRGRKNVNPARPKGDYVKVEIGGSTHNGVLFPKDIVPIINELGFPEPGWTSDQVALYKAQVYELIFPAKETEPRNTR